jgi:DNA end-binding protein Ku
MAGKAIWKGTLHIGTLDVPVKLHTAVSEERTQFHLLHKRDHARLKQQMVCAFEKVPVTTAEQARGFEVEDGKYILVDPEELERTDPAESRMIEIHEFVKTDQIDPLFISRTYYLEPDIHSQEYQALAAAMRELDVEGICTWNMRKRSYFGALEATEKILRLNMLRYGDEVIPAAALELQKIPLSEKELKIGSDLINQMTEAFQPQKFSNEHEKKLQNLIDKKARGEKIVILRPRRLKPTAPDKLLQTLEASLKKVA